MKNFERKSGIVATFITPFHEDGTIDEASVIREIEAGVQSGLTGFLVPCGASEIRFMEHKDQVRLFELAKQTAPDDFFLMPNIIGTTPDELREQAKEYMDLGARAININSRWTSASGPEEDFIRMVEAVNELNPDYLCIQDDTEPGIHVDLVSRLFKEFEHFTAIKYETKFCNRKYTELLDATNGEIDVWGGNSTPYAIEAYDRGISGFMPSGFFKIFVNIYKLYHEKSKEAAFRLYQDFLPVLMFTRQDDTLNRNTHKEYFRRLGIFETVVNKDPNQVMDRFNTPYMHEMIDLAQKIDANMDSYWK